jgi:hypothetical protein
VVTHCATLFIWSLELIEITLIKNYLALAFIKTILFFALSMKLASEFLGSDGTTSIPLLLTNVSGSKGKNFFI